MKKITISNKLEIWHEIYANYYGGEIIKCNIDIL